MCVKVKNKRHHTLDASSSMDFCSLVVGTENERCVLKRARADCIDEGPKSYTNSRDKQPHLKGKYA